MGDNGKEGRQRDCRCQHNQWESAQLCHKSKQEEHSGESIRIWNSSLWVDFWFCQFISEGVWWSMQFLRPCRRPSSTSDCQQSLSQSLCQEPSHWWGNWHPKINVPVVHCPENVCKDQLRWKEEIHLPSTSSEQEWRAKGLWYERVNDKQADCTDEKSFPRVHRETKEWYGSDPSGDVALCVDYRRNTRET